MGNDNHIATYARKSLIIIYDHWGIVDDRGKMTHDRRGIVDDHGKMTHDHTGIVHDRGEMTLGEDFLEHL